MSYTIASIKDLLSRCEVAYATNHNMRYIVIINTDNYDTAFSKDLNYTECQALYIKLVNAIMTGCFNFEIGKKMIEG